MRSKASTGVIMATAIATAALTLALATESRADPPCVRVVPEARFWGAGFNHVVHLTNTCAATADCTVSTDVNPEAQTVVVPGRSETEVVTFLSSPARVFVPSVTCKMRERG